MSPQRFPAVRAHAGRVRTSVRRPCQADRCIVRTVPFPSLCEKLANVLESLEFEGISARVEQEHGRLFSDLSLEAHVGLDDSGG